ncbi:hypothetical protein FAM4067_01767 [Lacticaseibacillus paracasei]|nr:hypothetical protein FAM4067_01767 [Lacticaseibacillus paracasei]
MFVIKLFERVDAYLIKGLIHKLNDMKLISDDLGLGKPHELSPDKLRSWRPSRKHISTIICKTPIEERIEIIKYVTKAK